MMEGEEEERTQLHTKADDDAAGHALIKYE